MSFFRKRRQAEPRPADAVDIMAAKYPAGTKFLYLGRPSVITHYIPIQPYVPSGIYFDYCDKHGVIHSLHAFAIEFPAIEAEINRRKSK